MSNLDDIFSESSGSKVRLLVDLNHMFHRCVFSVINEINESGGWNLLRHSLLSTLLASIGRHKADEVIVAVDSDKNWRKKIYPEYKAQRKEKKDNDSVDWDEANAVYENIIQEMEDYFPFKVIKQKWAEADDVISVLATRLESQPMWKNIIVSSDKDYKSLLRFRSVKQFDPVKKKMVDCLDPEAYLEEHILQGDNSDNIPGFAPRIGEKRAAKYRKNPDKLEEKLQEDESYRKALERNKVLIDPVNVPETLKERIMDKYVNYERPEKKGKIFDYFVEYELNALIDRVGKYEIMLNRLAENC